MQNKLVTVTALLAALLNVIMLGQSCVSDSNATEKKNEDLKIEHEALSSSANKKVSSDSSGDKRITHSEKKDLPALKDAYKNYFPIGAAIGTDTVLTPERLAFIKSQYNSVTPKIALQPLRIQPKEGVFTWNKIDPLVNFAFENNIKFRGHVLIFNAHTPKWFFMDGDKVASKELVLKRMNDHISTIMKHYKGKIYCWDVVNEAVYAKKTLFFSTDRFIEIVGEEYIEKAFIYARAADPDAKLFYNDGIYNEAKRDAIYGILKKLKDKKVPIDGVGIQCHLGKAGMTKEFLQSCIDKFSSLGLEVQITELDVSIYEKYGKKDAAKLVGVSDDYSSSIQDQQAKNYDDVFSVCRANKGKVTGVTLWGDADGLSSSFEKLMKKRNYQLLFDRDMKPKDKVLRKVVLF